MRIKQLVNNKIKQCARGSNAQDGISRRKKKINHTAPAIATHPATSDYVPKMFQKENTTPHVTCGTPQRGAGGE